MPNSEALFVEYRSRVFRYLARASGSTDTAQDLTQEVFLRVSRSGVPTAETGTIVGWLFRVARNVAVDHHRRHGRTPTVVSLETDHASAPSQEISTAIDQALARLDDTDRDVFLMREIAGLSYDEIGRACDLSPSAVRSRIYRARLQLRETLSADIAIARKRPIRHSGAPN
jgi:RNA polymerase sigma-70 factor (ECF subfamily)